MTSPTPSLIIHAGWAILGTHGHDSWILLDGDRVGFTQRDLTEARERIESDNNTTGITHMGPITVDESQLDAIEAGPQLDDCHNGCEAPGLVLIEGRVVCPGCAAGFGAREASA